MRKSLFFLKRRGYGGGGAVRGGGHKPTHRSFKKGENYQGNKVRRCRPGPYWSSLTVRARGPHTTRQMLLENGRTSTYSKQREGRSARWESQTCGCERRVSNEENRVLEEMRTQDWKTAKESLCLWGTGKKVGRCAHRKLGKERKMTKDKGFV